MKISDILQPWQKEFVDLCSSNRLVVGMVHRQAGKSFAVSYLAAREAILNGSSWIVVSNAERQAIELVRKCISMTKFMNGMLRGTPLEFSFEHNSSEIRFSTGGRILCVPNSPETIRGFSGNLIWDEAAFSPNADELWQAVAPFLASKYGGSKRAVVISTPAGESGTFYNLWSNQDFAHFKRTIYDTGKTDQDILELRKLCADDDIFAQEFECRFLDSNSALFSYELLRSCTYDELPKGEGEAFLGIDIGRTSDRTAIAILRRFNRINYIDHVETLQNKEFDEQFAYISKIIDSVKPVRVYSDATGIGMQLSEQLKKKYGGGVVVPMIFTNSTKNDIFTETKKQFGDHELLIPQMNLVIDDLHQIRRVVGPSGTVSFKADRDKNGHADIATSIALAVKAASKRRDVFMPLS